MKTENKTKKAKDGTTIGWTDYTFNPWIGCTKVSPGCKNCYAEAQDDFRFSKTLGDATKENPISHWGKGAPRHRTSAPNWKKPEQWNSTAVFWQECGSCGWRGDPGDSLECCPECNALPDQLTRTRPRVFCASMSDWLDDEVPIEWLADLLDLIRRTPNLDWQLLTKRPGNFESRLTAALEAQHRIGGQDQTVMFISDWLNIGGDSDNSPPGNVWIGTSVEDQQRANERIPELLEIPAAVRFLSCEPLLESVDMLIEGECSVWICPECSSKNVDPDRYGDDGKWWECFDCSASEDGEPDWKSQIDWVICGGESGNGARPFDLQWGRELRDQCAATGIAFFMKQLGTVPFDTLPMKSIPGSDSVISSETLSGANEFTLLDSAAVSLKNKKGEDWDEWPDAELRVREFPGAGGADGDVGVPGKQRLAAWNFELNKN